MKLSIYSSLLLTFFLVIFSSSTLKSAHVVGGEMTYRCLDSNRYEVTLILFRDCSPGQTGFPNTARFYYFDGSTGTRLSRPYIPLDTSFIVPVNAVSSCLIVPPGNCLEQAIYIDTILLPPTTNGYDVSYALRNRTNGSINMFNQNVSIALTTRIPPNDTLCNSSPTFNSFPPTILCINDPINIDYSATDADGDSLVYDFFTPYYTGVGWGGAISAPPYTPITWSAGFSQNSQVTASPALQIDSLTGLITGTPTGLGWFITGVSVKEYRNGVLLNETRRDFLLKIINCFPTSAAVTNPGVICNSYTVNFGNSSLSTPTTTFLWDFGDTSTLLDTSTLFSPQYTYPDTGVYSVTLISDPYSPACVDTTVRLIEIYPIIGPTFIKPPNQCFDGNSFDFTAGGAYFGTTQILWDFGSTAIPNTDTTLNPTGITFSSSGRKVISLRYLDYGCDTTFYDTITVFNNQVSNFSFSDNNCFDYTIDFYDSSSAAGNYYWDFGDTSSLTDTSTLANPTFVFPDTGTYTVMLIIDSNSSLCPDTSYQQVRIDPLLNPFFNKPANQCLLGNSFDFVAGGSFYDSTLIEWDFGPTATPSTDSIINPTGITFNSIGLKVISIRYQDFGCDTTFFDTIEVYQSPVSNFSFTDDHCINHTIQFFDSSLHTGNYYWDFGVTSTTSDTSTLANPTYTYPDSGIYTVMLVVDSNSSICPDTMYQQITIHPILSPFFNKPANQCILGNSFDFIAGGDLYDSTIVEWDFGSTATPSTSTSRNPMGITFSSIGKKAVSIRYRDFGCDTTFVDTIEVYQSPVANFSYTDDHCINHTIQFNDSSLHTGNYYWDFGVTSSTTDTSTSPNPIFTYPDSGTYTVMLVVDSNSSICPDTMYQQIIIHPILSPSFVSPMDQCLTGNSFDFTAGGAFYSGTQIDWYFDSTATQITSSLQNPSGIVYNSSGTKVVTIRYRDFGCDTSFVDSVAVYDNPVSNFSYTDDHCINHTIQFIDSSLFVGDYYWDFGVLGSTTDTSSSANPIFTYPDSGTYTVMLVIGSQYLSCPDTSYQQIRIDPILSPYYAKPANQCFTGNSFNFNAGGVFYDSTLITWDFGSTATPSTSSLQNPTGVVYNTPGIKPISIRYQDFGCDTTFLDSIHVYELPVANFIIDYVICVDLVTTFYDSSLYAGTYQWDFGVPGITTDTSSLQNPVFTYLDTGTYTVRLIVTSQYLLCAPDTIYKQVRIFPVLDPQFNLPDNQCFVGNAFNFIADTSSIYYPTTQFAWDFGPSATPNSDTTLNPPTVIFNTSGKKAISLIFTDFACVISKTDTIEVYDNPVSNFAFTDNNCHDLSVQFIDSTQFTTEYYWDFGVNSSTTDTSTSANPYFTYPDSGVYTIRLIADGNTSLCPDTSYRQISLNPILAPNFTKPANQCLSGNSFDFTAGGIYFDSTIVEWDFGSSATPSTSTSLNPTGIVFNTSGQKIITIRYREFGCDTSFSDTIEVYDNPVSNFAFTNNNCFDLTAQFSDSSLFATSYYWDFGVTTSTTDTSTNANPIFTYPDSGVYTVRFIVDGNISLCPDTSYQQITVNPLLNPYYSKPVDQCLTRNSFDFNAGGTFFSTTQIDWDFGPTATPSTSTLTNPTGITYSNIGLKPISIRYRDFGCDTTFIDTIEVHTSPTSNFSFSENNCIDFNVNFIDSSLLADFYNWDFGVIGSTTDTSTATNPSFTFPDSGTYNVMLIAGTNSSICPDTLIQQVVMYPLLSPFFTPPPNQCINGNSFDFNAGGNFYSTTQIDWDFGPSATPSTSTSSNPTGITFNSIGLKPVSVRYRANGCDTTYYDTIEVYQSPFSNFSYTENNCVDFTVQFTDSSLHAGDYYWDFGVIGSTTDTSTSPNPTFTFPDSGTYNVMLVIDSNSSICPDTSYQQVVMHPLLSPYFTAPANQCINGNSFDFNAGGAFYGTTQIDWYFGGTATPSTFTGANPTGITFNTIGKKPITIRYRANGCDTSYTDTIEIYVSPYSNFSFSDNNCVDYFIQFSDSSLDSKDYYWDFGDTTTLADTSNLANPSYTFPDSGVYNVMLVMGSKTSICPDTLYQVVTLHPLLSPFYTAPMDECFNENSFDFNAGGAFYSSTQIDWDFGATATPSTSTNTNPTGIVYSTIGVKPVSVRYSAFGCDTTFTDSIEVYPSPFADFRINESEYCIGDSLVVDLVSLSDAGLIHDWYFDDSVFLNEIAPVYVYQDTGIKDVRLVVENSYGCKDTMDRNNSIVVYPSPTALFSPVVLETSYYYPYVTFTNNSLNFNFSTFDNGDGVIVSPFSTFNSEYTIEGFYYPQLIVENMFGCLDTLNGEVFYEMKYNLYIPNSFTPNNDGNNDVFLPVINIDSNYNFKIFNRWGELIFETNDVKEGWDGSSSDGVPLKAGVYVFRIVYRDPKRVAKEIKGHVNLIR